MLYSLCIRNMYVALNKLKIDSRTRLHSSYSPRNPGIAPIGITNKLTSKSAIANDNKK